VSFTIEVDHQDDSPDGLLCGEPFDSGRPGAYVSCLSPMVNVVDGTNSTPNPVILANPSDNQPITACNPGGYLWLDQDYMPNGQPTPSGVPFCYSWMTSETILERLPSTINGETNYLPIPSFADNTAAVANPMWAYAWLYATVTPGVYPGQFPMDGSVTVTQDGTPADYYYPFSANLAPSTCETVSSNDGPNTTWTWNYAGAPDANGLCAASGIAVGGGPGSGGPKPPSPFRKAQINYQVAQMLVSARTPHVRNVYPEPPFSLAFRHHGPRPTRNPGPLTTSTVPTRIQNITLSLGFDGKMHPVITP